MPATDLHALVEQFCSHIGIAAPVLTPDHQGSLAFSTQLREVDFTVTQDPLRHPDDALVLVFLGQAPEDREVLILRELMNANLLMLQPQSLSFSRNPLTGSILLQYACPLAGASGESLRAGMENLIDTVLAWRQDYFLDGSGSPAPSILCNMLGRLA